MKTKLRLAALLLLPAILLSACTAIPPPTADETYTVPVLLRAVAGMQVTGENPVLVEPGEEAV